MGSGTAIKKTPVAPQHSRPKVQKARAEFANQQRRLDPNDLIFVDEAGCHPGIGPLRGWAPVGQPLFGPEQVYARSQHISMIGAMSLHGMVATMTTRGGVGSKDFRRFVEQRLAPVLRPGHVVCLDNLNAHKNATVRHLIEQRGARLLFLPPYSPDFNPIEAAWAKIKHWIRRLQALDIHQLRRSMYRAFKSVRPTDASGWFRYCGYSL